MVAVFGEAFAKQNGFYYKGLFAARTAAFGVRNLKKVYLQGIGESVWDEREGE